MSDPACLTPREAILKQLSEQALRVLAMWRHVDRYGRVSENTNQVTVHASPYKELRAACVTLAQRLERLRPLCPGCGLRLVEGDLGEFDLSCADCWDRGRNQEHVARSTLVERYGLSSRQAAIVARALSYVAYARASDPAEALVARLASASDAEILGLRNGGKKLLADVRAVFPHASPEQATREGP